MIERIMPIGSEEDPEDIDEDSPSRVSDAMQYAFCSLLLLFLLAIFFVINHLYLFRLICLSLARFQGPQFSRYQHASSTGLPHCPPECCQLHAKQ
jgi:hypothetical protein